MQYGKLVFILGGIQIRALYCIDMTSQSFLHYFQEEKAFKIFSVKVPVIRPGLTQNNL
jgi:hypothetical protein